MSFIDKLRNSDNKLLESQAVDILKWKNLNHTKKDLELFLQFNIAEIQFKKKNGQTSNIICTSNMKLVKLFNSKTKFEKQKALITVYPNLSDNDSFKTKTWDLIDNKIKTINLSFWQIMNFISIDKDNIILLDEVLSNILNKQ